MYAIELAAEFRARIDQLHPKRYKQVYLRVFTLQENPVPPDAEVLDAHTYRIHVGPYRISYEIDDAQHRVRVFLLEEKERE